MVKVEKGQEVSLSEMDPSLKRVSVGLGWDAPEEADGFPVDLDASAFLLNTKGKVRQDTDFVFYNNSDSESGAVKHLGDNETGSESGDDEAIEVNLEGLAFDVDKVVFAVTIHNASERGETFGLIHNAYMRVVDLDNNQELARFDLTEDASENNAFVFGEIYRDLEGWKFKALGEGSNEGLYKVALEYGVNVAPN